MTLEQWASLAEIIAAIAVVASLIYVARQLNQTTEMMRVNASNDRVHRDFELVSSVIGSKEVADVWVTGASRFDSLDEVDRQRAIFFEYRAIAIWHNVFSLRQQNLYPDSDWRWNEWMIRNLGQRQAVREAWRLFKGAYDRPFRNYIDGLLGETDSGVA